MMVDLRNNPLKEIADQRVVMVEDYQSSTALNLFTGEKETISIPKSNVLIYYLEDGSKICARPSGTEPKIKFYVSVNQPLDNMKNAVEVEAQLDQKIKYILQDLKIN